MSIPASQPSPQPDGLLTLVVVTHDSVRWLRPFFESWRDAVADAPELARSAVVVADAGSTDQIPAELARLRPDAKVLPVGHIGYGAAANAAIKAVGTPWVLLCNPDLTFPSGFGAEFLQPFTARTQRENEEWLKKAGVIAPRLVNPDGSVQPSVGRFPTIRGMLRDQFRRREERKYSFPQPTERCRIDWATGACLLINREAFESVGGFDPFFFLYMEEVDLQLRLAAAGYPSWFVPAEHGGVVHHAPNAARSARPEVQRWAARGLLRYFAKHGNALQLAACRGLILIAGRLACSEALAGRKTLLARRTGP